MREAIENARSQIERLPDLARSAAAAITDYVRGHGRAVFSVAAINFLNDRFTPIAAGKIEIDIGPAFPAFVQEPFENEIVAHRIDRRNSEAITDRAVGRAAATLDHNVVLAAEIDDVPDNQEISGEPEFNDERELFLELTFYFRAHRSVTLLRAEPNDRPQKRIHAVTGGNWKLRKFVAEIFQRKRQPL